MPKFSNQNSTVKAECIQQLPKYTDAATSPEERLSRWEALMLDGEYESAWKLADDDPDYECRGKQIRGKLLVRCLRGFGDAIQFLRFLPDLRDRVSSVWVLAPPRVLPLLRNMAGIDRAEVLEYPIRAEDFDNDVECSDLPYLCRADCTNLPGTTDFLRIPAHKHCDSISSAHLNVGIAWTAGTWNPTRSIDLEQFRSLAEIDHVRLYSLQRGDGAEQLINCSFGESVTQLEREGGDMLDTAASIRALDLVISVDTMVAHLAGTLGTPVWLLLQKHADWRWMKDREDSPWYPSMRIFRQRTEGDRSGLIEEVAQALGVVAHQREQGLPSGEVGGKL